MFLLFRHEEYLEFDLYSMKAVLMVPRTLPTSFSDVSRQGLIPTAATFPEHSMADHRSPEIKSPIGRAAFFLCGAAWRCRQNLGCRALALKHAVAMMAMYFLIRGRWGRGARGEGARLPAKGISRR
jgi:hypothetical protein